MLGERVYLIEVKLGSKWRVVRNTRVFGSYRGAREWMRNQELDMTQYRATKFTLGAA